jgi:hypothetical protein
MYLYANGCSMTYGSELHDEAGVCTNHEYRWRYSWPGRLRTLIGATGVYNDGYPSGSNDRIVRTTVEFVARWSRLGLPADHLLVVIGWSHPARREFYVDGGYRQVVPHHHYDIRTLNRLVAAYRRAADNADDAARRYAVHTTTLCSFLAQQGIRYLFFDGLTTAALPEHLRDSCVAAALVDERFIRPGETERTMVDFVRARADTWQIQHPNETGHQVWAERIAEEIDPRLLPDTDPDLLADAGLPLLGGSKAHRRHDRKGAERFGRFIRARRIKRRINQTGRTDLFVYP